MSLTPQLPEHIEANLREEKLSFEILRDPGNQIAREFGLAFEMPDYLRPFYEGFGVSLPEWNGDESWTLPIPASFVIDTGGVIRFAEGDPDYTVRPEPEELLEVIEGLGRTTG